MSRIVFFNRFYAPDHSATAQILTDLAEHLAGQGRPVTVVTSRAIYGQDQGLLPPHEMRAGVDILRIWTPKRRGGMVGRTAAYLAYYVAAFIAALRLTDRSIVLVVKTDPPLLSLPITLAAAMRGGRVVHWVQDLYPEIAAAFGMNTAVGPVGELLRSLRDWSFRRAARVVAIGNLMAGRVAAMGVPRDRIVVIPNWSDDRDVLPSAIRSPALRREWGIAADAFILEYSGNLGRAHEYDTLLGAARLLAGRDDIVFLFVGGGHMLDQLAARVADLAFTNFRFVPYQRRSRLSESLGAGDAHWISLRPQFEGLVVPSKVFGICAAARPVIAVCAAEGELNHILAPGESCLTVAPGDAAGLAKAITTLADDRAQGDRIGAAGRTMLERHYSRAAAFARWTAVLDDAAADGATRPR
uniref:glycosyltransferase family 4 protein n=1 Tax=Sphingomonas sp. TaxID=28214 RepID=UPI0025EC1346|nr:glycosyltransferase family 4 protein [Sphingomonas sp.]